MPTSDAKIRANQANAARSTGPKTAEGKAISRANSFQHGMTGAGVVATPEETAEVERRFASFRQELQPSGALSLTLVRRAATLAVRMEKCAEREMVTTSQRVAQAMVDCEVPDGVDIAEATRLRAEAGRRAAFDPSREATLARRYEAAAERGFFRALKEFRQVEKHAQATDPAPAEETLESELGSFGNEETWAGEFTAEPDWLVMPRPRTAFAEVTANPIGRADVPISIGRSR